VDSWSDNEWHHVVAVYQGASVDIYCDGSFKGSGAINPIVANDRPLFFGGMQDQYFNGKMDEVAIWNRSLSSDEVSSLYNINFRNSSSSIAKDVEQSLSLNLDNADYTWSVSCTDDANVIQTSEIRSLSVGSTNSTELNASDSSDVVYYSRIYYSDANLPLSGNNFNLRANDKIKFVVNLTNHTLTLNAFNVTHAKVLMQSNPIIAYLQKGILYEFDLNNDSVNDIRARYDGMNSTSRQAMVFIQEIKTDSKQIVEEKNIVANFFEKEIKHSYWRAIVAIVLVLLIILFFVWKKNRNRIEEYFWVRRIEKNHRNKRHYGFY
jgi:hypothetical protein